MFRQSSDPCQPEASTLAYKNAYNLTQGCTNNDDTPMNAPQKELARCVAQSRINAGNMSKCLKDQGGPDCSKPYECEADSPNVDSLGDANTVSPATANTVNTLTLLAYLVSLTLVMRYV